MMSGHRIQCECSHFRSFCGCSTSARVSLCTALGYTYTLSNSLPARLSSVSSTCNMIIALTHITLLLQLPALLAIDSTSIDILCNSSKCRLLLQLQRCQQRAG